MMHAAKEVLMEDWCLLYGNVSLQYLGNENFNLISKSPVFA